MKIYLNFSISAACTQTFTEIEEIKEIEKKDAKSSRNTSEGVQH